MAATLESSVHKHIHNLERELGRDKTGRQHKHIGIVVEAGQTSQLHIPAQSRADTLMLVERHSDTIALAT